MALKARLLKLDGLAAEVQALYRAEGDAFVLDVEAADGWNLENVDGLKSALGAQKTEIRTLTTANKAFEGLDPVVARDAIAKVAEFATLKPEEMAKAAVKEALQQAKTQFDTALAAKDGEITSLTSNLTEVLVDQAATQSLASRKGNVRLMLPHVKAQARAVKGADGKFVVEVLDAQGHPRVGKKDVTKNLTLDELVEEMSASTDFAPGFDATTLPGGGTRPNGGGGTGERPKVIQPGDQSAINDNLEAIASGKAVLAQA